VLLGFAAPALGATTPNACRYSLDTLYRDMPVAIDATASIVPDGRYPAPTEVVPGSKLRTTAGTANVQLPEYLARFGYNVGLLQPGLNQLQVKVWVAISATNTKERVQTVGPFDLTARTTITVDPADDNRFLSATPWQYTAPAIPALDWTALGGDVVFGQDAGGNLPQLPLGPGGALRAVTGSAVIHISFEGGAAIYMDCRPGATDVDIDFGGPTYKPGPVTPFDTEAGPKNTSCLNSVGRNVVGAPANFPDGFNREIDPMRIALSTSGAAAQYTVGTPYTLPATSLNAVLSADTLATLRSVGGLVLPDKTYPVEVGVTIAATNTAEGVRTVRAASTYTPTAGLGPVVLPETTWTPTGAGPIQFTLAAPGNAAAAGPTLPYGSVFLSLGTENAPATLDCAPAAIAIANPAIPWSDAGRTGSAGRYAIDANPARPVFASAVNSQQPPVETPTATPTATATASPQPTASPGPPAATPVPTATPTPVAKAPAGRIGSTRLSATRGGRIEVRLECQSGSSTCRGTIAVTSVSKIKLGKRAKTITLTRPARYTIAPGKRQIVTLRLSKDGRAALKRTRAIRSRIQIKTSAGVTATRRVTLSQRGS